MIQDIIVVPLIALFAGLCAIMVMRAMWKTKRRRRDVSALNNLGRAIDDRPPSGSGNWRR